MPDHAIFILRFCLFALLHSLFAVPSLKRRTGSNGTGEAHRYRLIYNLGSLILFGWVMSAYRHSPVLYFVPGKLGLIMYLLQAISLGLMFLCLRQTGVAVFFGIRHGSSPSENPITTGCYSVVRHPLYGLAMLFMVLNPVMSARWLLLTFLSACYFVIGGVVEERRLIKEYGDAYRQYRKRVPFVVPRFKRLTPPPGASV